ncbi:MAG: hypothetical protein ACKODZ_07970, partial [Verrucomicrobiota bacterium]
LERVFPLKLEDGADLAEGAGGFVLGHHEIVGVFSRLREVKGRVPVARLYGRGDALGVIR